MGLVRKFVYKSEIECPVSALFAWHLRQRAFERLTPPWLDVQVKGMPKLLEAGLKLDLKVTKFAVPLNCSFKITELETDKLFVDEQISGPFAFWRHEHRFEAISDERSLMNDEIRFTLPVGFIVDGFAAPFMERDLKRMFRYRHETLKQDLSSYMRNRLFARQKILLSSRQSPLAEPLVSYLTTQGHSVCENTFDGMTNVDDTGTCIALCDQNTDISRLENLIKDRLSHGRNLKVYIEIHDAYAGDNSNENFHRRCEPLRAASVRCMYIRTGAVLSPAFGVLKRNRGWSSETQPWIAVDDMIAAVEFCMLNDAIEGQIHMTANQKKPPTKDFRTLFDIQYPLRYSTLKAARSHILE